MQLHVIGSGSAGNCYILQAEDGQRLIIECGVRAASIKQAIDFDIESVAGVLLSHEHNDHSFGVRELLSWGLDVYATKGTWDALHISTNRAKILPEKGSFTIGYCNDFSIRAFDVKHDANEPVGFIIYHRECGAVLFATDTYYIKYKFNGLNNIIIEANYCEQIMQEKLNEKRFLRDRILQSHFSLQNCLGLLKANDLSQVNNICLIHLSDANSDARRFKSEVEQLTGKTVHIAEKGLKITFNKTPF